MPERLHNVISGIWYDDTDKPDTITHVQLHAYEGGSYGEGVKTIEGHVIALLKNGKQIWTMVWNYDTGAFNLGASVSIYRTHDGQERLRTFRDGTFTNNLEHMLNMGSLY